MTRSLPAADRWAGTLRAALLALLPLAAAALLTLLAASLDAAPFDDVVLLPPDGISPARLFLALAVLNEAIWRTQTTDFWVNFKVFGVVPLTFIFAALQFPLLQKYATNKDEQ